MKIYNEANRRTYYLPAARSGILQGHKAIASVMVAGSPLVGIDRLEIPRLTGVIADFITILLMFERRQEGPLAQIARFLETDLMQGSISLEADKLEYPEIYYQTSAARFQLHRTSSMVSELARNSTLEARCGGRRFR